MTRRRFLSLSAAPFVPETLALSRRHFGSLSIGLADGLTIRSLYAEDKKICLRVAPSKRT
jgi:hypothetical protein